MKLCVIGRARNGKDLFCEIVNKEFGISFRSSSDYMNEHFIFPVLKDKYGYKTLEECYNDRFNHRQEWYELIQEYNSKDQSRLAKNILKENDIYCGMRCGVQFEASKNLFDLIIWIDAEDRLGVTEDESSMTISKDKADIVITNNGTLEEFRERVIKVMTVILGSGYKDLVRRKKDFGKEVEKYLDWGVDREDLLDFYYYWSEHSKKGRKMRFEKEKTFDIKRRLVTWMKQKKKFSIAGMLQGFNKGKRK